MSLTPQRPFVPSAEGSSRHNTGTETPFRLIRPFVHGTAARQIPTEPVEAPLPGIEDFLESYSAAEPTVTTESAFDFSATDRLDEPADLPPIEHFTDPLPPVDNFAPFAAEPEQIISEHHSAEAEPEAEWVDTGWQDFDWNATAALGEASHPEASDDWSRTDWDSAPPQREQRETPAQAIATALDQIAQRIRSGDLLVPPADLIADPAAIAATLAALLGVRR